MVDSKWQSTLSLCVSFKFNLKEINKYALQCNVGYYLYRYSAANLCGHRVSLLTILEVVFRASLVITLGIIDADKTEIITQFTVNNNSI